jgi:hypothetical protein
MSSKFKTVAVSGVLFCLLSQTGIFASGTVTIMDDAHLRAALVGGGLVNFAVDGTITLTNTLTISSTTTIDGTGHQVTLDGSNAVRVITVTGPITLSLLNLTVSNGLALGTNGAVGANGGPGQGGGIYMTGGTLAISNCEFVANTAHGGDGSFSPSGPAPGGGLASGGAIEMNSGVLLATNCQFFGNSATGGNGNYGGFAAGLGNGGNGVGGAIHVTTNNTLIVGCVFQTNQVHGGGVVPGSPPGNAAAGGAWGGAISLEGGTLTNISCQFTANSGSSPSYGNLMNSINGGASRGGAVYNGGGNLTVSAGNFAANNVVGGLGSPSNPTKGGNGQGGGIYNQGQMTVSSSVFTFNTSVGGGPAGAGPGEGQGGAIYNGGPASASQSLFTSNAVQGAYGVEQTGTWLDSPSDGKGGAIFNTNSIGIVGCTFAGNEALGLDAIFEITPSPTSRGWGGAIFNSGTCNLTNDTLTANLSQGGTQANTGGNNPNGGDAYGGGLYNSTGTVFSVNNTFALNDAQAGTGLPNGTSYGGGIYSTNGGTTLVNTILTNGSFSANCFGTLLDSGHNLSSDSSCNFSAAGSLNNTDPKLAQLDNYGGPTPTMALLSGSPAIDGGGSPFPSTDQRGHARPFGPAPDIGAFESSPPYSIHGTVSGRTLRNEVTVIGTITGLSTNTTVTINGKYNLTVPFGGIWIVTPQNPNYVFVPTNRPVTTGPDAVGVNFSAYHWNEMSLDGTSNNTMQVVYPGTNGVSYRLLSSSNLVQWTAVATNTIGFTNYWEMFLPINPAGSQFYRMVTP